MHKSLAFFFFICIVLGMLKAQDVKKYDSTYIIREGQEGHAQFKYKGDIDAKFSIEGMFYYNWQKVEANGDSVVVLRENWEGSYEEHLKNGQWQYEYERNATRIQGMRANDLDYNLNSYHSNLTAEYQNGIPLGYWNYAQYDRDQESDELRPILNCQFIFSEGYINGPFYLEYSGEGDHWTVNGKAKNGLLSDTLTIEFKDQIESRIYNKGLLLRLDLNDGVHFDSLNYPLSTNTEKIKSSVDEEDDIKCTIRHGLFFNDGYPSNSKYILSQQKGNEIIQKVLDEMAFFDVGNDAVVKNPLSTQWAFYPLTGDETVGIEIVLEALVEYENKILEVEEEEIMDLSESQEATITYIHAWLKAEKSLIHLMKNAWNANTKDRIQHYYRDSLLTDSARVRMEVIPIALDDMTIELQVKAGENENNLIQFVKLQMEERFRLADSLHRVFRIAVQSMHLTQSIAKRNEQIIASIHKLDSGLEEHFKDPILNKMVNQIHYHYLDGIRDKEYQEFLGEAKDKKHQAIIGDSIILELKAIEKIYELCHSLARRRKKLDSIYTEYSFDPFTYTDHIPSRVKKRLYEIVANQMYNDLVDRATNQADPIHCLEQLETLYEIQGLLYELRYKETRDLEKQLKKNSGLDERIQILNNGLE